MNCCGNSKSIVCRGILMLLLLLCHGVAAWSQTNDTSWRPNIGGSYTPSALTTTVEYDAERGEYVKVEKLGDKVMNRSYMTFQEYQDWKMDQAMRKYWGEKTKNDSDYQGD
ncbi:MAG: hypothetical protein IJ620_00690, partial [Bacteroidales bacterium]|nr:hypothetical protein [Bacteroidales bacterium]